MKIKHPFLSRLSDFASRLISEIPNPKSAIVPPLSIIAFLLCLNTNTLSAQYCASKGIAPWETWIATMQLGSINNTSEKFKDATTAGYSDYTNVSTTLIRGQSYPLSITPSFGWSGNSPNIFGRVWIDFNQNNVFEDSELVAEQTDAQVLYQSVSMPTTATLGTTRMRVSVKWGSYPTACEAFEKGEVEDYTVELTDGVVQNTRRFQDSLQLLSLYYSTNGKNWSAKWDLNQPIHTWFGITLDAAGSVSEIKMNSNILTGKLPNLDLPNLSILLINSNRDLVRAIPNFNLPNLKTLNFSSNGLSGEIPNFNLPNLEVLELSYNKLIGSIPNFNLPKLTALWLISNQLTGTLSNFNLPNLKTLNLSNNQLSGSIPNFNLPNLAYLALSSNKLSGSIPNFNYPNLLNLFLDFNQLNGSIPNFNLPKLERFYLPNNQLSGTIPNFNCPELVELSFHNNQLSGSIPNFNLPKLLNLKLSLNQLSGSIPKFNLPDLRYLELDRNKLTGSIPSFNFPKLYVLLLNDNQLSGCIPLSLKYMCDRVGVNIHNNPQLIPTSFSAFCFSPTGACTDTVRPDLTLENLIPSTPSVQQGQVLNFRFDAKNIGTAHVTAPFTIKSYLSLDRILDANDYQDGTISTANYGAGTTINQIQGAMSIPNNLVIGNYYLIVKIDADNDINEGNEINNTLVTSTLINVFTPTNTTNYCPSKGNSPAELWVSKIQLNTITNVSDTFRASNSLGYSDYSIIKTRLMKGFTYPLSITPSLAESGNLSNAFCRAWIDFNGNQTYEASELILEKTGQNPLYQSFLVPNNAILGTTRMRVSLKSGDYPTPCDTFSKGEVEDYAVEITTVVNSNGSCRVHDSLYLVNLYNATNGANWSEYKWNLNTPMNAWSGITLTPDGCVQSVNLGYNNLTGLLPNIELSKLEILYFYGNSLEGNIPIINAPNLKRLVLTNNKFNGHIPIINTPNIEELELSGNSLIGTIPNFNYPNLTRLVIHSNQLTGTIPNFNCPRLASLQLSNNQLSGTIPNFNVTKLNYLDLRRNKLSGEIPNFNITFLYDILLSYNQLTGSIPNFDLAYLTYLDLKDNKLSGEIPNFMSPRLTYLDLSINKLSGAIPNFNVASLYNISLSNNQLTGTIPNFNLTSLRILALDTNQLNGCIPIALKSMCPYSFQINNNPDLATQNVAAFCSVNNTGACTTTTTTTNDLALSLVSTPSVYRQYTTQNFRITAQNSGTTAFSNVKIKFTKPVLTVAGGTKMASMGSFQDYCPGNIECAEWTIPTLAGGTTATLDVPLFVLNPIGGITASASLISSNPVDNSTANNTASVSINSANAPVIAPLIQSLIQSKPTQLIPVIIQKISPTITENYIVVELESIVDKTIDFNIINSFGSIVLIEKLTIEKGNNKRHFDVSQLPKGLYFIQTSVGKGLNVPTKFIKF